MLRRHFLNNFSLGTSSLMIPNLAKEFITALEHVVGPQEKILGVCIHPEDNMDKRREEIIESMKMIWERMKIVVEPSCSITLAAVLKSRDRFSGKKVGLIISGGNVDLERLPW